MILKLHMHSRLPRIIIHALLLAVLSPLCTHVQAMPEDARDWVMRMLQAGQSLNYKGNMIGIRESKVELMGIVHKIGAEGEQERIYSLNGIPREIIRKSGELICYLPDKNKGLQSKLFQDQRFFPSFTDSELDKLDRYYSFELGEMGRILNRQAQLIKIMPRDEFRYGYRLWIDKETGLLLSSACVDHDDNPLEQYMFTDVQIDIDIPDADLEPSPLAMEGLTWTETRANEPKDTSELACKLENLPQGYELIYAMDKPATDNENMMSQYVFSDGLSTFSLFVEHMYKPDEMKMQGAYQLGIVNVYSRIVEDNRITLMGEIPKVTAKAVAMAVSDCD